MSIRILIADSEALFAEALAIALSALGDFQVCGEQPTEGPAAIEEILIHRPDVAVMDYWLRRMEGPAATIAIRAQVPDTKVVLLCWFHGAREVRFGLASGAAGLLSKNLSLEEIADGIRKVHQGQSPVVDPAFSHMLQEPDKLNSARSALEKIEKLTPRELQVLSLLGDGQRVPNIAATLAVKTATVNRHIHNILAKTQTRSQFEAVALGRQHGLLQP
ncbi:MAG: LuxR C-terminal-related transcriptional regulator [Actinomycetota bacterium]